MAEKNVNWDKADEDILHQGKRIVLPADPAHMPTKTAIEALERKLKDEEQILQAVEYIDSHPMDGAVAFMKAMKEEYGWASPVPTMTFFGPKPPTLLTVKTGPGKNDSIPCIWGAFMLPGVEKPMNTGALEYEGRPMFVIHGQVRKREMGIVKRLAETTREILARESIYKGKAIRLKVNAQGQIKQDNPPDFLPTAYISPGDLILNEGEAEQVKVSLWTPIEHTEACVENKIPLKRGVLLEGPYGCGKTMTANVTAQVCVDNQWTFVLLDDVGALREALMFAKRYEPAVVFAEDAERAVGQRDQRGNDILNTIDGILGKDSKVITVLTTNHVELIERAMLRPGRLDAVISLGHPNANSVQKLIRIYARKLLPKDEDLSEVGTELQSQKAIPATVREVVERSKLAMISRGGNQLTAHDLLVAAKGMISHLKLLEDKPKETGVGERLASALHDVVFDGKGKQIEEIHETVKDIRAIV